MRRSFRYLLGLPLIGVAWLLVQQNSGQQTSEDTGPARTGIFAGHDPGIGGYVLVFSVGDPGSAGMARIIDDPMILRRYRNDIDIRHGFTDFLPGEGRPANLWMYAFHNGVSIGGTRVTQRERITLPTEIHDVSRVEPILSAPGFLRLPIGDPALNPIGWVDPVVSNFGPPACRGEALSQPRPAVIHPSERSALLQKSAASRIHTANPWVQGSGMTRPEPTRYRTTN